MENTSYALHIAAGFMIAIMVIGLIMYVYRAMSTEQKSEDDVFLATTKAEFNEAFLVYDKPLMYGTDVLSCLNKAQSNNQKYVYNNYYGTDLSSVESRKEHLINVEVTLKSDVQEVITVYYRNKQGKLVAYTNNKVLETVSAGLFSDNAKYFKLNPIQYYFFDTTNKVIKEGVGKYSETMWGNKIINKLQTQTIKTKLQGNKTYYLYNSNNSNIQLNQLSALLSTVTTVEQTILNKDYNDKLQDELQKDQVKAYEKVWYSATWRTAVYDFKTKKFKCKGVEYNSETGYINKIIFEEI